MAIGILDYLNGILGDPAQQQLTPQDRFARMQLGGEDTPAGGGLLDAVGQRIMQQGPQAQPAMASYAQQPQQGQGAAQVAAGDMRPQQGGTGLLGMLFGGRRSGGTNSTVQWLMNKGFDPGAAQAIASDPQTLRSVVAQYGAPQSNDPKAGLMSVGSDSAVYDARSGQWIKNPYAKPDGDNDLTANIKEYQYAVQNGQFKGTFTDWQQKGIREQDPTFGREKDLRDEYVKGQEFKRYSDVRASYERIREGAKDASGAGDIALVYGYMKLLDPGSVVREGEFATAENAGGVPTKVQALYNKIVSGERLTPEQRAEFLRNADNIYGQEVKRIGVLNQRYTDIARQYNLEPNRIIVAPTEYPALGVQDLGGAPSSPPVDYKTKYGLE